MTPATSPSVIKLTAAPALRTAPIRLAWRGRSRIMAGNCFRFAAFGLGEIDNVFFGWRVEIDDIVWVTRPHRDLVHVDVRRVEERSVLGQSKGCDSTRHILGAQRRALERVDGDVHFRPRSGADLL